MAKDKKPFNCPHCGGLISDHEDLTKDDKIKQLQEKFYDSLVEFVDEFGSEMIREFYDYWSEPNRSKTKILYQLQKTWDTKRRLQRWKRNNFNNEKNRTNNRRGFESDTTRRAIEQVQNGFTE
jgi:hypothetical protein